MKPFLLFTIISSSSLYAMDDTNANPTIKTDPINKIAMQEDARPYGQQLPLTDPCYDSICCCCACCLKCWISFNKD